MNIPAELKYTKDHEWVKIEGDTAIVGITDFAQSELGDIVFVDVDFQTGKCYLEERELREQDFAFDHYAIIQESINRIQGRLDWNPTFLYLLGEEFTVYEATELVNLINPRRPIVSNNFLVKYGNYVEEVGLKRVPKKKPRKTYRLTP